MMQAAHLWNLDDHAESRRLDSPSVGCIFTEREVSARPVIVGEVAGQDAAQVASAQEKDVVQALPPLPAASFNQGPEVGLERLSP
jgi:hypothetical protein